MTFRSEQAIQLAKAAARVARDGLGVHYHPRTLAPVWRDAKPENWARLAVLAAVAPPDAVIRAAAIDEMEAMARRTVCEDRAEAHLVSGIIRDRAG